MKIEDDESYVFLREGWKEEKQKNSDELRKEQSQTDLLDER